MERGRRDLTTEHTEQTGTRRSRGLGEVEGEAALTRGVIGQCEGDDGVVVSAGRGGVAVASAGERVQAERFEFVREDRIGLEATYYNKRSRDALVSRSPAPISAVSK